MAWVRERRVQIDSVTVIYTYGNATLIGTMIIFRTQPQAYSTILFCYKPIPCVNARPPNTPAEEAGWPVAPV